MLSMIPPLQCPVHTSQVVFCLSLFHHLLPSTTLTHLRPFPRHLNRHFDNILASALPASFPLERNTILPPSAEVASLGVALPSAGDEKPLFLSLLGSPRSLCSLVTMAGGPVISLVGATGALLLSRAFTLSIPHLLIRTPCLVAQRFAGLVGSALLTAFLDAVTTNRIGTLRILTSSPDSIKLAPARTHPSGRVEIHQIAYVIPDTLDKALNGADVLVSAMGASENEQGKYEDNKQKLLDAAVKAGVKIYVPSEFGTDHTKPPLQDYVQSPMFENKQHHHREAEQRGLQVLAFYNALIMEISFSDWLGISTSSPDTKWSIPRPSHPVAFTSLRDLGPFVLSALLQTLSSSATPSDVSAPIPSGLRIYSDLKTLDEAADIWERVAGGKVERDYIDTDGLKERYEKIKPSLAPGMLGPAIPLMISLVRRPAPAADLPTLTLHSSYTTGRLRLHSRQCERPSQRWRFQLHPADGRGLLDGEGA